METAIRVMLADDHHLFTDSVYTLLSEFPQIEVIARAYSGDETLYQLRRFRTDVLLLDINMPGRDGLCVLEVIQRQKLPVGVIILTSYDDTSLMKKCLALGAMGYLLKEVSADELVDAIQTVAAGKKYTAPSLQRTVHYREDPYDQFTLKYKLNERELNILRMITQEKSSDEIADELCVSSHTVDAARKALFKKLDVRSVVGLVNIAWRHLLV